MDPFSVESFQSLIGAATLNEWTHGFKDFGKYVVRPKWQLKINLIKWPARNKGRRVWRPSGPRGPWRHMGTHTLGKSLYQVFIHKDLSSSHCCCLVTKSCWTLLWPHGLQPTKLLCPWGFPGKHSGVACHLLLQGIFLKQGLNLHLPELAGGFFTIEPPGKPS